jgi:hypothetical protein
MFGIRFVLLVHCQGTVEIASNTLLVSQITNKLLSVCVFCSHIYCIRFNSCSTGSPHSFLFEADETHYDKTTLFVSFAE